MGGKAKIIDPDQMTELYVAAKKYSMVIDGESEKISLTLNKLNDPGFQSGLSGGQGEAIKGAIKQITKAFTELKATMTKTAKFIDDKLASQAVLSRDKHGAADIEAKARATAAQMQLGK